MKARVSHLHRTAAEWLKFKNWVPEAGELAIYDPDENYNYARIKVGDGKTPLQHLNFFTDSAVTAYIQKHLNILDAGRITEYTTKP